MNNMQPVALWKGKHKLQQQSKFFHRAYQFMVLLAAALQKLDMIPLLFYKTSHRANYDSQWQLKQHELRKLLSNMTCL